MTDTFQDDFFADELPPPGDGTGKARTEEAPQADDTVERKPRRGAISLAPAAAQYQDLAAQLPPLLRMGVSTWSYPGWEGLVWDGAYDSSVLAKKGLTAYHQHPLLRTVCVDRTFWRPLTASQYAAFAAQVDADFRFVVKCPAGITDAQVRSEEGKPRESNPAFLDPNLAIEHFVQPTLEGLGSKASPHAVQQAFIDEQAAQCGYCMNGTIMTAKALLDRIPNPSDEQIRNELRGNLCRCGAYSNIRDAIEDALPACRARGGEQ